MRHRRHAFTLVELLIVLSIIAMLGALLAFTLPGFLDRSRASNGAQSLQSWLNYARQRAMYEQAPRGLRLVFEPREVTISEDFDADGALDPGEDLSGNGLLDLKVTVFLPVIVLCQYIEKPEDYMGDSTHLLITHSSDPNPATPSILQSNVDFADGSVDVGDYLEVLGTGQVHQIIAMASSDPAAFPLKKDKFLLASTLPNKIESTAPLANFRIIRKPRVTGDEALKMPDRVIITSGCTGSPDGYMTAQYSKFGGFVPKAVVTDPAPLPAGPKGYIDILFGPSGAVLDTGGSKIILWVRGEDAFDSSQKLPPELATAFNPTLVVVYVHTGAVAAYDPVADLTGGPYQKVK